MQPSAPTNAATVNWNAYTQAPPPSVYPSYGQPQAANVPAQYPTMPVPVQSMPYQPAALPQADVGGTVPSNNTLYVKNLPRETTEEEIRAAFTEYGVVKELRMQRDKETQEFFGTCFVEFLHPSAANLAMVQMKGKAWGDSILIIEYAKNKRPRSSPSPTGGVPGATGGVASAGAYDPYGYASMYAGYYGYGMPATSVYPGYSGSSNPQAPQGVPDSSTLYIRGLPLETTEEELKTAFSEFGKIKEVRMQFHKTTGEFFGTVFVQFLHASAASLAMTKMTSKPWGENHLTIEFARNKRPKRTPASATTEATPSPSLFIAGLPSEADREYLRGLFSRYGDIVDARILQNAYGPNKGIGFVDFKVQESADFAIEQLNGMTIAGQQLTVTYSVNPGRKREDTGEEPALKKQRVDQVPGYPVGSDVMVPPQMQQMPVQPLYQQMPQYPGAVAPVGAIDPVAAAGYLPA